MEQSKSSEDLEFQKLEREMKREEKESESQELLREIAECQRLSVTRKVQSLSERVLLIVFILHVVHVKKKNCSAAIACKSLAQEGIKNVVL